MGHAWNVSVALWTLIVVLAADVSANANQVPVDFGRQIRPILAKRCFACHGPDDAAREAGLRLDRRESAISERRQRPGGHRARSARCK